MLQLSILGGALCMPNMNSRADLLAYYVDGEDVDAAALVDQAASSLVNASSLSNVGFEAGSVITRTEFGAPSTPAGPTAGSSIGSQWLFARASTVQATPSIATDYFGFTITATDLPLSLETLTFDVSNIANDAGGITTVFETFASVDAAPFTSFGSHTISTATTDPLGTFKGPTTEVVDLSGITGATSVEIRIALGDNSGLNSKSSWVQGIKLEGIAVPEPNSMFLFAAGICGLFIRRRAARP